MGVVVQPEDRAHAGVQSVGRGKDLGDREAIRGRLAEV